MGALSPVGVIAAQIYALGSDERLDLVGSYGFPADYSATFRSIPLSMSLPACDAFTSTKAVSVRAVSLSQNYPLIGLRPGDAAIPAEATRIVSVPCLWSQVPIGALSLLQEARPEPEPQEWLYLDGVAAATAMWMNSQRPYLVEHWRRVGRARSGCCRIDGAAPSARSGVEPARPRSAPDIRMLRQSWLRKVPVLQPRLTQHVPRRHDVRLVAQTPHGGQGLAARTRPRG